MDSRRDELLPGSHACVGCRGLTFRQRQDSLCPRCAFEAESLIERIEVEGLHRDLQLITEFEAYYRERETQRTRFKKLAGPVFCSPPIAAELCRTEPPPFKRDLFWSELREAS